ncbi:unnamed protein product [Cylicostephanus goldi]|uniref:Abnormal cell migration protein 18-like fibronectin type I domain-containing protein n=1 Tax=Cylicostephanus goldi TaxID=71465 RepID=A0A3P6R5M0_CYLGO|nr:unnamed protein product [Cylicostephanus goldi]
MLWSILLILVITTIVFAADGADEVDMKSAFVHLVQNFSDIGSTLDALPKECTKLGKTYKEGEDFIVGNLRYKCRKYGVYTIEGCITDQKENLKIGEVVVRNNIKSQCLGVHFSTGSSVFYRETPCGTLGEPKCDRIGPPKSYEEAKKEAQNTANFTGISVPGLPPGWKLIEQRQQAVPGTNKRMLSRTLLYNIAGSTSRRCGRCIDPDVIDTMAANVS